MTAESTTLKNHQKHIRGGATSVRHFVGQTYCGWASEILPKGWLKPCRWDKPSTSWRIITDQPAKATAVRLRLMVGGYTATIGWLKKLNFRIYTLSIFTWLCQEKCRSKHWSISFNRHWFLLNYRIELRYTICSHPSSPKLLGWLHQFLCVKLWANTPPFFDRLVGRSNQLFEGQTVGEIGWSGTFSLFFGLVESPLDCGWFIQSAMAGSSIAIFLLVQQRVPHSVMDIVCSTSLSTKRDSNFGREPLKNHPMWEQTFIRFWPLPTVFLDLENQHMKS